MREGSFGRMEGRAPRRVRRDSGLSRAFSSPPRPRPSPLRGSLENQMPVAPEDGQAPYSPSPHLLASSPEAFIRSEAEAQRELAAQWERNTTGASNTDHNDAHQFFYFAPPKDPYVERAPSSEGPSVSASVLPSRPGPLSIFLMGCAPCLSSNPCSEEKVAEYRVTPKTVVFFLSLLQILLFVIAVFGGGFAPLSHNWMIGPTAERLVRMGAKYGPMLRYDYQMVRLVSPMLLHSGLIQLVVNLYYQLRLGLYLEPRWGWATFCCVYFVSGAAGILFSCVVEPNSVAVASSYGTLGVVSAWIAQLNMTWESLEGWQKKMNAAVCFAVVLICFLQGIGHTYIDISGNLGAFLMGLLLGYVFFAPNKVAQWDHFLARAISIGGTLLVLFIFFVLLTLFYSVSSVDPAPTDMSQFEYSVSEASPLSGLTSEFLNEANSYYSQWSSSALDPLPGGD